MLRIKLGATLAVVTSIALVAAGCMGSASGGTAAVLQRLEPLVENCDGPLNGYGGIDFSSTGRGDSTLSDERLAALRDVTDQVVACGGYMKVVAFSASSAETFTLGEEDLPTSSGTDTARLLQGDENASSLFDEVEDNLTLAASQLTPNGSDILAQLELARQYQDQRSEGTLRVELATDGIATTKPVKMNTPAFTEAVARSEAEQVEVPDLTGATVHITGIGKTTGDRQLHTSRVNAITDFYSIACNRTNAVCKVTTDSTKGG